MLRRNVFYVVSALMMALMLSKAYAIDVYEFNNDQHREDFKALSFELRCLVCQNQNLADSNAPLAKDLRDQVHQQLAEGKSKDEVVSFLTDRYGEFVLYKPQFSAKNALLWGGPIAILLLVLGGFLIAIYRSNQQSKMPMNAEHDELASLAKSVTEKEGK